MDKISGRFADASLVHPIYHKGRSYQVEGPLNFPDHRAKIPLIQAGASEAGKDFAASVADAVFAATPDRDMAIELRKDLRKRAVVKGRAADDILLFPALNLYLAKSRKEAQELYEETLGPADKSRKLAFIKKMIGLDLCIVCYGDTFTKFRKAASYQGRLLS